MFSLVEIDTADWTAHDVYIILDRKKTSINLREPRNELQKKFIEIYIKLYNIAYKMTSIETSTVFLQENPEFRKTIRPIFNNESHGELKRLHEENTALLLSLKISQRETEIHKKAVSKWRNECENLMSEIVLLRAELAEQKSQKTVNPPEMSKIEKQRRWNKSFDYESSDEEEE